MNPKDQESDEAAERQRERRFIQQWQDKIRKDRAAAESSFKEMRENIRFARGLQWRGQTKLDDDRYVCNLVQRNISQGVALLYARNPEVEASRRERMDFQLWDGKEESIAAAHQALNLAAQANGGDAGAAATAQPLAAAMLRDYTEGQMWRDMVERVCKTLKITIQYMFDNLQPSFKLQMKQLVRRVKTCKVGYVQINYVDGFEGTHSTSETESTITDRAKRVKYIADKMDKGDIEESNPEVTKAEHNLKSAISSIETGDTQNVNQRITFDFLPSTSVIVDRRCRCLKGFVGARHITIEKFNDIDEVNACYDCNIPSDKAKSYSTGGKEMVVADPEVKTPDQTKKKVAIWEVEDLDSKTMFTLCDGYDKFVVKPQPMLPETNHFWSVIPLTFNDVEYDGSDTDEGDLGFYPPSDVELMQSAQKEWNRTRQALRVHRIANRPKIAVPKGSLTDEDKETINNASDDCPILEFQGIPPGQRVGDFFAPLTGPQIQPQMYDTSPLSQDIQLAAGTQESDMGRAQPKVTATGATIAEQARTSVASSNVDDLDDFLSEIAEMCGEIILRYFKLETVQRIAGRGAVLPEQNREDFLNEIMMSTKAASSGRPNKAVDIANFERIMPLLIQALTNPTGPFVGLAEEGLRRLDDRLDLTKLMQQGPPPPMSQQPQQPGKPGANEGTVSQPANSQRQPLAENPGQQPVPLAAA